MRATSACVRQKRQSFIPVFSLILAAASCSGPRAPSKAEVSDLQANIDDLKADIDKGPPPFVAKDPLSQNHWDSTRQVYTLRQFQPVLSSADVVLQTLQNASADGLNPEDFDVGGLQTLRDSLKSSPDSAKENELDLHLTYSLVRYVSQLCFGRIDPRMINPEWPETGRNCDVDQIVFDALQKNTVENLSEQLSPGITEYQGLKQTLQRYRDIAAQGGWQTVQASKERGSRGVPDGALLAATLEGTGDLETAVGNEMPSRSAVREALARFQARHGLESKKTLDAKTLAAMNVPIDQRIEQIEINMDRMRWIAHRLEPKHVLVNVPGFQLSVHDGDQIPLQMRAIVGSMENPTPIMDDQIEYVAFSPYWNIPISIAVKEFLPKIKKDRNYLRSQELEVVRTSGGKTQVVEPSNVKWEKLEDAEYQLRQKPGTKNALGLVKFMFPNSYNVYLHDTPSGNLFYRLTRSLSHGCVRIERSADFAAYVLQDQAEWTPGRIQEAMHAQKEQNVPLKTKLPIHVVYWTAWADAEGNAQFREDVYGFDQKHRELVSKTVNASLPAANPSGVNMHKVGRRVVAHAAALDGQSRLPEK